MNGKKYSANGSSYFRLPRSLLDAWRKDFTVEEIGALVLLMSKACYEDQTAPTAKGDLLKRGQLVVSIRGLAQSLQWSEKKVRLFLDKLKRTGWGTQKGTRKGTLLTLDFYASSQGAGHTKGHKEGQPINKDKEIVISQQALQAMREKHRTGGATFAETVPDISNTTNPQPAAEGAACRSD